MIALPPPFVTAPGIGTGGGLRRGFFGRRGGVSDGIYYSLNTRPGPHDQPGKVTENRMRVAHAMGLDDPARLVSLHQVHSARAVILEDVPVPPRPQADAMVTATPGLGLCILTADCVPVLFADAKAGVIGAAHAGWKGALAGVCEATLCEMERLGAWRDTIHAAIGPAIGQASYEVGPEFRSRFLDDAPESATRFVPGRADRFQFDLPGFVHDRLLASGVAGVACIGHDTCAMAGDYFSNRRRTHQDEPDYGRNASVILLSR